jgi:hypothetical protein
MIDEEGLAFAEQSSFKYVCCDKEGKIKGWGRGRETMEKHMQEKGEKYDVYTLLQYRKAFGETRIEVTLANGEKEVYDNLRQAFLATKLDIPVLKRMLKGEVFRPAFERMTGGKVTPEIIARHRRMEGATAKYIQ